jgi:hypothetical protein
MKNRLKAIVAVIILCFAFSRLPASALNADEPSMSLVRIAGTDSYTLTATAGENGFLIGDEITYSVYLDDVLQGIPIETVLDEDVEPYGAYTMDTIDFSEFDGSEVRIDVTVNGTLINQYNMSYYVISVETNTDGRTTTTYNLALAPGNVINMNDISDGTTAQMSAMTTMGFSGFSMTSFTLSTPAEYYAVENVEYMDANNLEVDGITANGYVSRVVLQKLSDDEMPASVAVALYKSNGQLQNIVTTQIDGTELTGETIDCTVNLPFGQVVAGTGVKVFVWDSFGGLKPLAGVYNYVDESGVSVSISATAGKSSVLTISASGIESFEGRIFTVTYDNTALSLVDAVAVTSAQNDISAGVAADTDIEIVDIGANSFSFAVDRTVPSGKTWSGVLDLVRFNGLTAGVTSVAVSVQ